MRITWLAVALVAGVVSQEYPAAAQVAPPRVSPVNVQDALAGNSVQLVLVKDWIKIENTGGLAGSVEFERYCPAADEEQVVLGRWISARTEGGTDLPADLAATIEDPAGNLVQRLRLRPMPPKQRATVMLTTLVARRERPEPTAPCPVPKPGEYPEAVRAYLAPSPMVAVDDPYVREVAAEILAKTHDAMGIASELARRAKERPYLPPDGADQSLSTAAGVLKHGGSCCGSAVAAAAVLRACGVPAQVTYCPAGYVHGIVRFWVHGHGWVRMDATSGTGKLPLMSEESDLGLVRLFDTPMRMERTPWAYAWPYQHNNIDGELPFFVDGAKSKQVRMAVEQGGGLPWQQEPFPHLEPGSWNAVLGSEALAKFGDWAALVKESREAVQAGRGAAFKGIVERAGAGRYVEVAEEWAVVK